MNLKSLSLFSFPFIALCFTVANATTFNIRNNCPYRVWAAAVPASDRQLSMGGTWNLNVNPTPQEPVSGVEPTANSTESGEADAKLVTVEDYCSVKPMVRPQTPWLNSH
ncbi:hypothetical protein V6N13_023674 [Hibiscus sabdariffa]|uniref:Uncharacterized protein n=1 Tax=Hibiscus sabdariffa TaxID=183260 RepID=A0ABR2PN83_9ROSI